MRFEIRGDVWKFRNICGVGSGGGNIGAGKVAGIGFAGGKNLGNYYLVGVLEGGRIIGESGLGAAEGMGLYDGPNP